MDSTNELRLPDRAPTSITSGSSSGRSLFSRYRRDTGDVATEPPKGQYGLTTLCASDARTVADLILVHGLGGGSRSTWTYNSDPPTYWPQDWLPRDPDFEDVRIHVFGYNSNWDKESSLNIHDFAKSLLNAIQDCPAIPRASSTPIVFIGHSMGGLVIKKAYILSKQFREYASIAQRVRAIFFLATPHRGADLAQLLTKVLQIKSGARPFVNDLHRNSLATQTINDEFPQHCMDLQLYSFYETLAMNYGVGKGIVVDKDTATLGYQNERTAYMHANHREICKYATTTDPNYLTLRNALAATIAGFRDARRTAQRAVDGDQQRRLDHLLGVTGTPEDDRFLVDQRRMRGSCKWLVAKDNFQQWQRGVGAPIYWIAAKPATGKSVLAGYVVQHLEDYGEDHFYYFYKHGDQAKSTVGAFLRSIAWQMARRHLEIHEALLASIDKDEELDKLHYRTIWRKLFVEVILRIQFQQPQFIILDGLDECRADDDLIPLLLKLTEVSTIRLLVTCRNRFESYRQIRQGATKVIAYEIHTDDTNADIRLFLEANMEHLPLADAAAQREMVDQVLSKSAGCFLWVRLVLQELEQVHTFAEIQQVLEEAPSDMDQLYSRILNAMSKAQHGKRLARAILIWTTCAVRPMTTQELYHALELDIEDTVDRIDKAIASTCGHLVYVDHRSRVQLIHASAREYLMRRDNASEFAIDRKDAHKRLILTCLRYLQGNEMQSPRQRRVAGRHVVKEPCAFIAYACTALFEHWGHVDSTDGDVLSSGAQFFGAPNVLAWIEYLARTGNLVCLIQTGKTIQHFLQRRQKHAIPVGREIATLDSWATDLVRLVTKFGKHLATSPSAIHHLVPPFCPPASAPYKQFANTARGIAVVGPSAKTWDDCLSTLYFHQESVSALGCGSRYFAVGLSSGKVVIYHEMTCQEAHTIHVKEPVKYIELGATEKRLVICAVRNVYVFLTESWQREHSFPLAALPMAVALADEDQLLIGALKNNQMMVWDLTTGETREPIDWSLDFQGMRGHAARSPAFASFCVAQGLLAIAYRGQDIVLWNYEAESRPETYSKEAGAFPLQERRRGGIVSVLAVLLSSIAGIHTLAAAYTDGDLLLFDVEKGTIKASVYANTQILTSSSDGRTLASGDSNGTIQLFDFETLSFLYRIKSEDYGIKSLVFSADCRRLLDIRGSHCRVWDPLVLYRQSIDDEQSDTVSVSTVAHETELVSPDDIIVITALACHPDGQWFFCGKEDGSVCRYDIKTGQSMQTLYRHVADVAVVSILFNQPGLITSLDESSRVLVHRLLQPSWEVGKPLFDHRAGIAVDQLLGNSEGSRFLVCFELQAVLYGIEGDAIDELKTLAWEARGLSRWHSHPRKPHILILVTGRTVQLYQWSSLERLVEADMILEAPELEGLSIRSLKSCFSGGVIATTYAGDLSALSASTLLLWDAKAFDAATPHAKPIPNSQSLANQVIYLIGAYGPRLVFLHADGWIYSAEPRSFGVTRHFFVPADWLTSNFQLLIEVTRNGDIVFVKRDEVAVIKRGLELADTIGTLSPSRQPLMAARRESPNARTSLSPGRQSLSAARRPSVAGGPVSSSMEHPYHDRHGSV